MKFLGEAFARGPDMWAYPKQPLQHFWRSFGLFIVLLLAFFLLQAICGAMVAVFGFGIGNEQITALSQIVSGQADSTSAPEIFATYLKSMVIGMFPAGILCAILALYLSHFGLPGRAGLLPMAWPKFTSLGWLCVIVGFVIFMGLAFNLIFAIMGIDPATYQTTAQGLSDTKSQAGLVEKTMADLAHDPKLFVLALPGATIAGPIAEELIFRGALFAGIAQSRLGRAGAVVITAALWALAHSMAAPGMFVGILFVMGLVLGVLLLRFGSLWVTIACHTAWNVMSTLALFGLGNAP